MLKFSFAAFGKILLAAAVLLGCAQQGLAQVDLGKSKRKSKPNKTAEEVVQDKDKEKEKDKESSDGKATEKKSRSLFDGKTLNGWESIEFGGEGDIQVADGEIQMLPGDPLTGICVIEGTELPTVNYEISLKGVKRDGHDFFCGLTFPVKDNFCTLILGGWGGSLVGLSNLDGRDASENGTKVTRKFEKNKWYDIRVRVVPEKIIVWIGKEKVIDESIKGREVSIRNDVIPTTPLGITNFITESAFKDIKIRTID